MIEVRPNIKLYNADCMDIMREYPDGYFDLAIVDPPYGIKKENTFRGQGGFYNEWTTKNEYPEKDWDGAIPSCEYFQILLSKAKYVIIFGGNYFSIHLPKGNHWIVWDKVNTMPTFSDCELIYTNYPRNSVKKFTYSNNGLLGKQKDRIHPTQKPVALYRWLLDNYAKPGMKILDTHLGSGSHAIAAHYFGVGEFIGVELDKDYFEASVKRIRENTAQADLFKPHTARPEPEQTKLF